MATLELIDVSYTYPYCSKPALSEVSLSLKTGTKLVVLGANGSGKTTLARIAAGMTAPANGQVDLYGTAPQGGWNGIGFLFQNPDEQFITGDVESEIAFGLENLKIPAAEMKTQVEAALKRFNLQPISRNSPETLSDGEKQLTALASILIMKPAFLILDEVTAFLDPFWTKKIREMSVEMSNSAGLIWITTNAREAVNADRVMILKEGKQAHSGLPENVLTPQILADAGIEPLHGKPSSNPL